MDELRSLLEEIRPDLDFDKEKNLIDGKVLDSFDIIAIASEINETFDLSINVHELVPDNFNCIEHMWALIQKMQEL